MQNKIPQKMAHILAVTFAYTLSVFSHKMQLLLGKYFGTLWYLVDFPHRKISYRNLRFAFSSEKTDHEIKKIIKSNFQQFGMIIFEWLIVKYKKPGSLKPLISVEGLEHFLSTKEKNTSVILMGSHFGNWEYAHLYMSQNIAPIHFIVRNLENTFFEHERSSFNKRFGVFIHYKYQGLRNILRIIEKEGNLILFPDRKANHIEGIPSLFFGKKTSTLSIISQLAMKYHLPVVPMCIIRSKNLTSHRLVFFPPLPFKYERSKENLDYNTQLQNNMLEKIIRAHPDHWLWFHRKWKHFHPQIYK